MIETDKTIACHGTAYGFQFGALLVERMCSDEKKGWTMLSLRTPKGEVQVYVTRTGKVRFFKPGVGEFELTPKTDPAPVG
jgi:hypothetical protein